MASTQPQATVQQRLGQQLLGPLEDAVGLARRFRELQALRNYVGERLPLVVPACLLILVTAIACGLTPVMSLLGTQAASALAGLLLAPVVLAGSLFVLTLTFFSWLEERSLARSLGRRTGRAPGKLARWLKRKLGADLGKPPRVPWLLALLFVVLPLAVLVARAPVAATLLVVLLVLGPVLYARLDR
jgi:hypothetical protein